MSSKLSKILKLSGNLTKAELMMLNQAVVSLIKTQQDVDFKKAAITFAKGDIVSFKDSSGVRTQGVVTKKNPKTLRVTTPDNYYVNIPATYLTSVKNPSKVLLDFKAQVTSPREGVRVILEIETENDTFH